MQTLLVTGDREWGYPERIHQILARFKLQHGVFTLIHGAARGADTMAAASAVALKCPVQSYPVSSMDWVRYGRWAGPRRNRVMLDQKPTRVMAFHASLWESRGTKDCVEEALRRGYMVPVFTRLDEYFLTTLGELRALRGEQQMRELIGR